MGMLSMIKTAPKAALKALNKTGFALKKARPQILVFGGMAIAGAAFIWMVCNARKIDQTIAEGEEKVEEAEQKLHDISEAVNLSEEEKKQKTKEAEKEVNKAKADSVMKMFMLVGPPAITFLGGMAMTAGGHIELFKRFGQVSTLLAATQESFRRYRQQNIADHGEECDRRYIYGIKGEETVIEKITDENGKEKNVKCKVPVVEDGTGHNLYTFEFSENFSRKCPKDPVSTISYLRSQEKFWNTWMLATGKPVTLSMVLEELGIELDPDDPMNDYIYIAGWRPNGDGDNKIDFGIMRAINKKALGMEENVVMLEFNCDGNIYHSVRYTKDGEKKGGK